MVLFPFLALTVQLTSMLWIGFFKIRSHSPPERSEHSATYPYTALPVTLLATATSGESTAETTRASWASWPCVFTPAGWPDILVNFYLFIHSKYFSIVNPCSKTLTGFTG